MTAIDAAVGARGRTVSHAAARPAPQPATTAPAPARDRAIDAARGILLLVVVALHGVMVGVGIGPAGPELGNALEHTAGFAAASWLVQVMPLFFVVGGFASFTHWRRLRGRGASATDYVRSRVDRLLRPAVAMVAVVAGALAALALAGLPAELVETAGFRIGQPLWFLAVYLGVSGLVPWMVRLHERAPLRTIAALAAVAIAIDTTRFATGLDGIGFANLLVVWLLMQQLGFLLADGSVDRMPVRLRVAAAVGALGLLVAITLVGPYDPDMYENLNPPTTALVLLGVAQLALLSIVRPALARFAERPRIARAVGAVNERSMTIYLWHLPVMVLLAGLLLVGNAVAGLSVPDPLGAEWWATRPVWLVAVGLALWPVVRAFERLERGRPRTAGTAGTVGAAGLRVAPVARPAVAPTAVAVVAGVVGTGVLLVFGFTPLPALLALALFLVARRLGRGAADAARGPRGPRAARAPRAQRGSRRSGTATAAIDAASA